MCELKRTICGTPTKPPQPRSEIEAGRQSARKEGGGVVVEEKQKRWNAVLGRILQRQGYNFAALKLGN